MAITDSIIGKTTTISNLSLSLSLCSEAGTRICRLGYLFAEFSLPVMTCHILIRPNPTRYYKGVLKKCTLNAAFE